MIAKGRCCQTRQWEVTNEMKCLALQSGPGRIESNGNRQKLKCLDSQNPIPFMLFFNVINMFSQLSVVGNILNL